MISKKAYTQRKMKAREAKALKATWDNVKRFGGMSDPTPATLTRYIDALDDLRYELDLRFDDLGSGPSSAGGRLSQERDHALALLARLRITGIKPSNLI